MRDAKMTRKKSQVLSRLPSVLCAVLCCAVLCCAFMLRESKLEHIDVSSRLHPTRLHLGLTLAIR